MEHEAKDEISRIAQKVLEIDSLEMCGKDGHDYHTRPVDAIKDALTQAFEAGRLAERLENKKQNNNAKKSKP